MEEWRGLFFRTLGDEAAVGGEGVGAGEEAKVGPIIVDYDEVVTVAKLELVDHVGEGVAGVDDVLVVEGHHQFTDGKGVVELGLEDGLSNVVHND